MSDRFQNLSQSLPEGFRGQFTETTATIHHNDRLIFSSDSMQFRRPSTWTDEETDQEYNVIDAVRRHYKARALRRLRKP